MRDTMKQVTKRTANTLLLKNSNIVIFWIMAPCSLVTTLCQGTYCLHLQGLNEMLGHIKPVLVPFFNFTRIIIQIVDLFLSLTISFSYLTAICEPIV
jgi:hypothetical protein